MRGRTLFPVDLQMARIRLLGKWDTDPEPGRPLSLRCRRLSKRLRVRLAPPFRKRGAHSLWIAFGIVPPPSSPDPSPYRRLFSRGCVECLLGPLSLHSPTPHC